MIPFAENAAATLQKPLQQKIAKEAVSLEIL